MFERYHHSRKIQQQSKKRAHTVERNGTSSRNYGANRRMIRRQLWKSITMVEIYGASCRRKRRQPSTSAVPTVERYDATRHDTIRVEIYGNRRKPQTIRCLISGTAVKSTSDIQKLSDFVDHYKYYTTRTNVARAIEVLHAACNHEFSDEKFDLRPMLMESRCRKVLQTIQKTFG